MFIFKTTNIHKLLILYVLVLFSCRIHPVDNEKYSITKYAQSNDGMVVSAHPLASNVGVDILKMGGNAVDAAIAVQFALAVVYPGAGNIGGGGFMVIQSQKGVSDCIDYREKAPLKATEKMYQDSNGIVIDSLSKFGALAAGVPGSVDGMVLAFEHYSQLKDWKALIQPAIDLANNGFPITENEANQLNSKQSDFKNNNRFITQFERAHWEKGDILVQKDLAHTLELIRDNGRDGFYSGEVAQAIVDEMQAMGGLISLEDMNSYHATQRTPITTQYKGYDIISMPPPSSGGICLVQLLRTIEPYPIHEMGFHSAESVHMMVEAERRVYADRSEHLGDPDYYKVPMKTLLSSEYNADRFKDFDRQKATKSQDVKPGIIEHEETTHVSIIDMDGNAVSLTTTLNGGYGSCTVVKGCGFLLNNEMDDFSVKPGVPNMFGLVGAEANKIEPSKRMLSSMTPTIVMKDGKIKMIVGTPGGSTIITSVFQVVVNVIDFGMDVSQAVQSPRFHHQWLPDTIYMEPNALSEETMQKLKDIGHNFSVKNQIGRVEAIVVDSSGIRHGAADKRGDDTVVGY
ncbi:MAG: gamma-glutamyltransferase [Lewinellaceae bacterium]|nr:gamma-glutamyltransferase [Lewinellaceae bacterium]